MQDYFECACAEELGLVSSFQADRLAAVDAEAMGVQLRASVLAAVPQEDRDAVRESLSPVNFTDIALGTLQANVFERSLARGTV